MKSRPVIFLDIDGPLCTGRSHLAFGGKGLMRHLDPTSTRLVARLVKETDSELVLSSTWRRHYDQLAMTAILTNAGFDVVPWHKNWCTKMDLGRFGIVFRGSEIDQWLKENKTKKYLILDDSSDIYEHQKPFHVQPDVEEGFGYYDYKKALKILKGKK